MASAVSGLVWDLLKKSLWGKWLGLLFTLGVSSTVTFLSVAGRQLAIGAPTGKAIGLGMVATAGVMITVVLASPLSRKLLYAFPTQELAEAAAAAFTVVESGKPPTETKRPEGETLPPKSETPAAQPATAPQPPEQSGP